MRFPAMTYVPVHGGRGGRQAPASGALVYTPVLLSLYLSVSHSVGHRPSPRDAARSHAEHDEEIDHRGGEIQQTEHGQVVLGVALVHPERERVPAGAATPESRDGKKKA